MHEIELTYIHRLQESLRSPFLDTFFIGWNFVDSFGFTVILIGIAWYCIKRSIGIRLFYILLLSFLTNSLLKSLFDLPRPCQVDPSVGILCFKSPGFPSGAAQTASLIAGIVFLESKKWWYRFLGLIFALFLVFSRVYLGVHYFTDILGGLGVGSLLLIVYHKLFPLLQKYWKVLSLLFPWAIFIFVPTLRFESWISLGVAIGLILGDKLNFQTLKMKKGRFIETFFAIIGTFLIIQTTKFAPSFKLFLLSVSGFWFSFLSSFLFRKCAPKFFS